MFAHKSWEKHGIRMWWHVTLNSTVRLECYWWSNHCGFSFGPDADGWDISVRLPPFALYLTLEGFGLWRPMETCVAHWDNDRTFQIPDRREFTVSMSDWTIRFALWARQMEWNKKDPWWIRGVSLDLKDLVLGRTHYEKEVIGRVPCAVPMPEGTYPAVATIERHTWKRSRWFPRSRTDVWLEIPKGIPHAGKGENSWDCGDDGLFGIGGATVKDAIERAQASVLKARKRYGHASEQAVKEALGY